MNKEVDLLIDLLRRRDYFVLHNKPMPDQLLAQLDSQMSLVSRRLIKRLINNVSVVTDIENEKHICYVIEVANGQIVHAGLSMSSQEILDNLDYSYSVCDERFISHIGKVNLTFDSLPPLRSVIRYIVDNRQKSHLVELARKLRIDKDHLKCVEVGERVQILVSLLPYYFKTTSENGSDKYIPAKLARMSNGYYRALICTNQREIIDEILHNDNNLHVQVQNRYFYDKFGKIVKK